MLTSWRQQMKGLVRTRKEIDGALRHTHKLETTEGGTYQDTERNRPNEAYSHPGNGRRRNLSGHGKNPASEAHSHPEDGSGRDLSGHRKNRMSKAHSQPGDDRGRDFVRTRKIDRARGTHNLEMAKGRACQDTERNRPSEMHSPAGDSRGRDLSGHGNKSTERGALTS